MFLPHPGGDKWPRWRLISFLLSLLATIWPTGQSPRQVVLFLGLSVLGHKALNLQQWSKLLGRHEQQGLPGATPFFSHSFPPSPSSFLQFFPSCTYWFNKKWRCYNLLSTNQTSLEHLLHCFLHCRPVTTASGRHVRLGTVSLAPSGELQY